MLDFNKIPIIDHHAHSLSRIDKINSHAEFSRWFTESSHEKTQKYSVQNTLFFRTALNYLSEFYNCKKNIDCIIDSRNKFTNQQLIKIIFNDINIEHIFCDYDLQLPNPYTLEEQTELTGCKYSSVFRLETFAEKLINETSDFASFAEKYSTILKNKILSKKCIAFKSILAYRSGLIIYDTSYKSAEADYNFLKSKRSIKLNNNSKKLLDYLFHSALKITEKYNFPMQIHTGFGDNDLNLYNANPVHLTEIIKKYKYTEFILLHAGWPYYKECSYLAALYDNVHIDLSLMIPFTSSGIIPALIEVFGIVPFNKILFATDAFVLPEIYWLAVKIGRKSIAEVFEKFYNEKLLSAVEIEQYSFDIFYNNAKKLYSDER